MKRSLLLGLSLLLLHVVAISAAAQSTHRDHPTELDSNEIKGEIEGKEVEYFYSFVAGRGEVTITVDVKSTDGTTGINFELLDGKGADSLVSGYAQADSTGTSGRKIESAKIGSRQRVILRLTPFKYGAGKYRIRISGATELK